MPTGQRHNFPVNVYLGTTEGLQLMLRRSYYRYAPRSRERHGPKKSFMIYVYTSIGFTDTLVWCIGAPLSHDVKRVLGLSIGEMRRVCAPRAPKR